MNLNLNIIAEEELFTTENNSEETKIQNIDDIIYEDFETKLKQYEDELEEYDEDSENDEQIDEYELTEFENVPLEQAVQDYQDGISEAFDYIYNHYRPKLERLSFRKNDQDIFPELSEVLWRAVKTFDINGGAKFNTYFWKCARNHMGTLNIRKAAKKRTAEFGTVSMQQSVSVKDSEVDFGSFIEDKNSDICFEDSMFYIFLEKNIYPHLKNNEIDAIKMLLKGYTLEEIGQHLNGITAPAVHVKFRRLADKKIVGKQLRELYNMYCS